MKVPGREIRERQNTKEILVSERAAEDKGDIW